MAQMETEQVIRDMWPLPILSDHICLEPKKMLWASRLNVIIINLISPKATDIWEKTNAFFPILKYSICTFFLHRWRVFKRQAFYDKAPIFTPGFVNGTKWKVPNPVILCAVSQFPYPDHLSLVTVSGFLLYQSHLLPVKPRNLLPDW